MLALFFSAIFKMSSFICASFLQFFHFCSNSYISLECRDSDVEKFLLQLTCNRIMVLKMVRILISTIYHTIPNFHTYIRRNNESSIFYLTHSSFLLNHFYSEICISFEIVTIDSTKICKFKFDCES